MALTNKLSAIGDAIRDKTGKTAKMTLDEMPAEIAAIEGGGDVPAVNEKWELVNTFAGNGETTILSITKDSEGNDFSDTWKKMLIKVIQPDSGIGIQLDLWDGTGEVNSSYTFKAGDTSAKLAIFELEQTSYGLWRLRCYPSISYSSNLGLAVKVANVSATNRFPEVATSPMIKRIFLTDANGPIGTTTLTADYRGEIWGVRA